MIRELSYSVSESRLCSIIRESIDSLLLTESQESKSIHAAKRRVMKRFNYDEEKAHDIINELRNTISSLKKGKCGKFVEGVARMYCDGQLRDTNIMSQLNTTLMYVASDAHINEYDRNLNDMSAQELIDRFVANVEMDLENDRYKISQKEYTEPSEYEIVRIDSYEQATEYYEYTYPGSRWCLTYREGMYEKYTCGGVNQIYFCLKRGFENLEPIPGENSPLDEYGLSMLSVIVNENGSLVHCTSRWNHKNGGNDDVMNTEQISDVIRMRFYDVFKPNTTWRDTVNKAMQRLANGEDPRNVFDRCDDFFDGFARIKLKNKYNIINRNGELLSKNRWFEYIGHIWSGCFVEVKLGYKCNYLSQNGEILYKPNEPNQWFDEVTYFYNGFASVRLKGKWNYINQNGVILYKPNEPDQWFDGCSVFKKGFAKVRIDNQYNYINQNGDILSKNQWFDRCYDFHNGLSAIEIDGKWNFINQNGEILYKPNEPNQWFDWCGSFYEGFAKVDSCGLYNFINQNGDILSKKQWFYECDDFSGGFAKVNFKGKWHYLDRNGNITEEPPQVSESRIRNIIRECVMDFIKMDK